VFDARRTSLEGRAPKPKIRGLEDSSGLEQGPEWRVQPEPDCSDITEYLDAKYSAEVVGTLEKIVQRAAEFSPHEVEAKAVGSREIRFYFEEAHRCYVYGLSTACALLCRATLERAFEQKVDPEGNIEAVCRKEGRSDKYQYDLIENSNLDSPLQEAAKEIRHAGNNAIHDYGKFEKYDAPLVAERLANMRLVLAALYPRFPEASAVDSAITRALT